MASAWDAWRAAAVRGDVDAALRAFYGDIDAEVAAGPARCDLSGRCCNFDAFGHRLYVTALEVAWFLSNVECRAPSDGLKGPDSGRVRLPQFDIRHSTFENDPTCPYQIDGLCSQHAVRPLGCRVFFCQAGTEDWQHDLYERYLARLKALHARFDVPYRYLEWRAGLDEALQNESAVTDTPATPSGDG